MTRLITLIVRMEKGTVSRSQRKSRLPLSALANTLGLAGTIHFQYGLTSTALTSTTTKTALTTTAAAPVKVSAALTGLKAATTYYFQFVVTTAAGTATGPIQTFTTI